MGGHDFMTSSTGKDASAAYRSACDQATWEDGHDAYNGTISTTGGFRELPADAFKGMSRKTRVAILEILSTEGSSMIRRALGTDRIPGGKKASWEDQDAASLRRRTKKLSAPARELLGRLAHHADCVEKRGTCLALELGKPTRPARRGERLYAFAGIAAS
jgi:hypothetical protein